MDLFVVIIIIVAIVAAVSLSKAGPYYLLAILVPLFPAFRLRLPGSIPVYFLDIVLLTGLIKYILLALGDKSKLEKNPYSPFLLLVAAGGVISYLIGIIALGNQVSYATYALARTLLPLTGFLWAFRLFSYDRKLIKNTVALFISSSTVMSLLGMGVLFRLEPIMRFTRAIAPLSDSLGSIITEPIYRGRLAYDMEPATAAGALLLVVFFVTACLYAGKKKGLRSTAFLIVAIAINTVALVLTFSRSALAGFFVGLLALTVITVRKRRYSIKNRKSVLAVLTISILALAIGVFIVVGSIENSSPFAMRYKVHFGLEGEEVRFGEESRIDMVWSSLGNIVGDPVPGLLGSGNGSLMIGKRDRVASGDAGYSKFYAHDYFLVHMMYWGAIGLIAFLWIYISIWIRLVRLSSSQCIDDPNDTILANLLICLLPALLVTFLAEHAFISKPALSVLLWFLLGAGSYMIAHYRRGIATEAQE